VTLGAVAVLVPFGVALSRLRAVWRRQSERSQGLAEQLATGVDELVRNTDLWRTHGADVRVVDAVRRAGERATDAQARADARRATLSGFNEVLGALAVLGAVAIVQRTDFGGVHGSLVASSAILLMAYRPLRDLGDARGWRARGAIALETLNLTDTVRAPAERDQEPFVGQSPQTLHGASFGAHARGPRIDFLVEPGELVVFMGPTGAGKTTLLRAMLGLEPASGRLAYSERDLVSAPVGPSARPFAWVPQDAPLVTATVVDNVALLATAHEPAPEPGTPASDYDRSRAIAALEALGAGRLASMADELVGPGGRSLSGGERRQVALARALATRLPVLLLDEPTEGLDPAAERDVLNALERLKGQRSVIVVSHRANVAAIADRVVEIS
jgi:ABC-type transport system involved in cytochrome bd biosynthesis fused ATPase/permease subunit